MYRIKQPNRSTIYNFYRDYRKYVRDGVWFFLSGGTITITLQDKAQTQVVVGVDSGSPTDIFLQNLTRTSFLRCLMTACPGDLPAIISYVSGLFSNKTKHFAFEKLKINDYRVLYGSAPRIDHFYSVIYNIFVDRIFDGKDQYGKGVFDKTKFCRDSGVVICPYCGAEDITTHHAVRPSGIITAKPDIDHFLPKGKYPFLAMTYGNLIPCSVPCNRSLKNQIDPLNSLFPLQYKMLNPYEFDYDAVIFSYDIKNANYYKKNAYLVRLKYPKDPTLAVGYSQTMGIDSLYEQKKEQIVQLYTQMAGVANDYYDMLKNMGVPTANRKRSKPMMDMLFGCNDLDEYAQCNPYAKFKFDIAIQLIDDSRFQWPW